MPSSNGEKQTLMKIIVTLLSVIILLGGWGFNYALGTVEKQIEKLQIKVDGLPVRIKELQGLDALVLQRIDRIEEDVKELKK